MSFVNLTVSWYLKQRRKRVEAYLKQPDDVQQKLLLELVAAARDTEWGKRFDFKSITSIKQYTERFPIQTYEDAKPYIQRMMQGERDLLWRGRVEWFSKSSGTTDDKSKYIPVSTENLKGCHIEGGHDVMMWFYENRSDAKIFDGKSLLMGGTHGVFNRSPLTQVGDVSAVMLQNTSRLLKYFFTPDMPTLLSADWGQKIQKMTRICAKENVTQIGGVPTWTMVLLREILKYTNKKDIREVWPNLQLYAHGGVSFSPYREQFKEMLPSTVSYLETYNASEGFFAVQNDLMTDDMLLLLNNGVYFELLPLENVGDSAATTVQLHEAELHKSYALVISTNAGLWRYVIGDTIKLTSKKPYKIKITGRTKHFINAFGEEVMVENTDAALAAVCATTGARVSEYTVAPVYMSASGKGKHEWLIEFEHPPSDLALFSHLLDDKLKTLNSDYESKRFKDIALERLAVRSMPKGSFHDWLRSKGKYGGQHKVPRLANHREYVEQLLTFVGL